MTEMKAQGLGTAPSVSDGRHLRLAAVADIHCARTSRGKLRPLFAQMAEEADVLLLGGIIWWVLRRGRRLAKSN